MLLINTIGRRLGQTSVTWHVLSWPGQANFRLPLIQTWFDEMFGVSILMMQTRNIGLCSRTSTTITDSSAFCCWRSSATRSQLVWKWIAPLSASWKWANVSEGSLLDLTTNGSSTMLIGLRDTLASKNTKQSGSLLLSPVLNLTAMATSPEVRYSFAGTADNLLPICFLISFTKSLCRHSCCLCTF